MDENNFSQNMDTYLDNLGKFESFEHECNSVRSQEHKLLDYKTQKLWPYSLYKLELV